MEATSKQSATKFEERLLSNFVHEIGKEQFQKKKKYCTRCRRYTLDDGVSCGRIGSKLFQEIGMLHFWILMGDRGQGMAWCNGVS